MTSANPSTAYISLGSNIDPLANLRRAVELLGQRTTLRAVSHAYRTPPQGFTDQPDFYNAAVKITTDLDILTLKHEVLDWIERELERVRDPNNKNAPRTIDLDISLWNDDAFSYGEKPWRIPDPDILRFAHVCLPLAEIAPYYFFSLRDPRRLIEIAAQFSETNFERIQFIELNSVFVLLSSNAKENAVGSSYFLLETECEIKRDSPAYWILPHPDYTTPLDNWMFAIVEVNQQNEPDHFQANVLNPIIDTVTRKLNSGERFEMELLLWKHYSLESPTPSVSIYSKRIAEEAHIAALIAEIEPDLIHPIEKMTLRQIAERFDLNQRRFYKKEYWHDY